MKKIQWKDLFKRVVIAAAGIMIIGFGASVFLLLGLGSDPLAVFNQGISETTGFLTIGQSLIILSTVIAVPLFFYNRAYISIGSIMHMFLTGVFFDLFLALMQPIVNENMAFAWRLIIMVPACALIAYGVSLYTIVNIGVGPVDLISIVLAEIIQKIQFRWVRVAVDVSFAVLGYLLGGKVGIGTVFFALIFGHFLQFWNKYNKKLWKSVLEKPELPVSGKEQ